MTSVDQVIRAFGGATAFARALGLKISAASEMKRRGSIPVIYWPDLVKVSASHGVDGVTYESLTLMHARERVAS